MIDVEGIVGRIKRTRYYCEMRESPIQQMNILDGHGVSVSVSLCVWVSVCVFVYILMVSKNGQHVLKADEIMRRATLIIGSAFYNLPLVQWSLSKPALVRHKPAEGIIVTGKIR